MNVSIWTCPHCQQRVEFQVDRSVRQNVMCGACGGSLRILVDAASESDVGGQSSEGLPNKSLPNKSLPEDSVTVYQCGQCRGEFQLADDQTDVEVTCPHCREIVKVERTATPPASPTNVDRALEPSEQTLSQIANGPSPSGTPPETEIPPVRITLATTDGAVQAPPAEVVFSTEDGAVTLTEPKAVAKVGDLKRNLRRLDSAERARRRTVRNLALWVIGSIILVTVAIWRM